MPQSDLDYARGVREVIFRTPDRVAANKLWTAYQRWLAEHHYHERWEWQEKPMLPPKPPMGEYVLVELRCTAGKSFGGE